MNVAEDDARDARAFPETEPVIGDFAEIAEPPAPAPPPAPPPPPAPIDEDGFADFSDDDEASGPAATPVPPASKVSALLKKGVTIAPPTNTPVGSDALARPSVFDAAPAPEPKPLDDASATTAAAAAAAADEGTETEPERAAETAAPTAPIETTFDEDGFADFESDEEATKDDDAKDDDAPHHASIPTRTTTTHDDEKNDDAETRAPASDVSSSDPMAPLSRDERARFDATFDAYVADDETGLSGAQLVQITAGAGLANADLSRMWQLVAAPGAGALRRDDFAIFCRLLSRRAAGDPLPAAIDGATRARFFADSGGETTTERNDDVARRSDAPTDARTETSPTTNVDRTAVTSISSVTVEPPSSNANDDSRPIAVVVESVRGVKDAAKMQNVSAVLRLVAASGEPLEEPRATPMGAATVRAGGVVVFESPVQLSTTYGALPRGASLLLELRHFKKPKMSVKCWAAFDARAIFFGNRAGAKKLAKPVKPDAASVAKAKPWMKSGDGDVTVRFQ